jgi:hypothetical protein
MWIYKSWTIGAEITGATLVWLDSKWMCFCIFVLNRRLNSKAPTLFQVGMLYFRAGRKWPRESRGAESPGPESGQKRAQTGYSGRPVIQVHDRMLGQPSPRQLRNLLDCTHAVEVKHLGVRCPQAHQVAMNDARCEIPAAKAVMVHDGIRRFASVMPTTVSGNAQAAVLAIAERAADLL